MTVDSTLVIYVLSIDTDPPKIEEIPWICTTMVHHPTLLIFFSELMIFPTRLQKRVRPSKKNENPIIRINVRYRPGAKIFSWSVPGHFSMTWALWNWKPGPIERHSRVCSHFTTHPVTWPAPFSMWLILSGHSPGLPQSLPSHEKTCLPQNQTQWSFQIN